jgi:hypothetical protein
MCVGITHGGRNFQLVQLLACMMDAWAQTHHPFNPASNNKQHRIEP